MHQQYLHTIVEALGFFAHHTNSHFLLFLRLLLFLLALAHFLGWLGSSRFLVRNLLLVVVLVHVFIIVAPFAKLSLLALLFLCQLSGVLVFVVRFNIRSIVILQRRLLPLDDLRRALEGVQLLAVFWDIAFLLIVDER